MKGKGLVTSRRRCRVVVFVLFCGVHAASSLFFVSWCRIGTVASWPCCGVASSRSCVVSVSVSHRGIVSSSSCCVSSSLWHIGLVVSSSSCRAGSVVSSFHVVSCPGPSSVVVAL